MQTVSSRVWTRNAMSIFYDSNHDTTSSIKLATVVEGGQNAPFSIATTPRCSGGSYSIPSIAPLYPWYIPYFAEC